MSDFEHARNLLEMYNDFVTVNNLWEVEVMGMALTELEYFWKTEVNEEGRFVPCPGCIEWQTGVLMREIEAAQEILEIMQAKMLDNWTEGKTWRCGEHEQ